VNPLARDPLAQREDVAKKKKKERSYRDEDKRKIFHENPSSKYA
jgi:hypothetical protein